LITNTKDRRISTDIEGDRISITESGRYLPYGYKRHKWEYQTIELTRDELAQIAKEWLGVTAGVAELKP
jgi:hypothetical protein